MLIFNAVQGSGGFDGMQFVKITRYLKMPRLLRMGKLVKYLQNFKYANLARIFHLIVVMNWKKYLRQLEWLKT